MIGKSRFAAALLVFALSLGLGEARIFAAEDATQPAETPVRKPLPGALLERVEKTVDSLDLSADQRAKIDGIFATTRKEIAALAKTEAGPERAEKFRVVFENLRKNIGAELTSEQKMALGQKMRGGTLPTLVDRIKEQLAKPEFGLTDSQKKQVDTILDATRAKLESLRSSSKDAESFKEGARDVLEDMKQKLGDVLTSEQQEKLQAARERATKPN